jgi:VanZ family protein
MFFAFSAALYLDITKKRTGYKLLSVIMIAIIISFGLAALTEMLQYLIIPLNRSGSASDLLSDLLGNIGGVILSVLIRRRSSVVP